MKVKKEEKFEKQDIITNQNDLKQEEIIEVQKNNKTRDISVDIIRIVGCLIVILTHLSLQVLNQAYNRIDWSRLLEKCFLSDGVPIFFMITGFFLVNGRSYKKIWKSTIKKIIIPTLVFILFTQVFYMFITNKESFLWCVQNLIYNIDIIAIIKAILTGSINTINSLCSHLWYILSYVKIIIWIPILWLLCKEEKISILARRIIIGFSFLAFLITDIQRFITIPVVGPIKVFELVGKEILYVLLGYELFIHKDKIKNNKKVCIFSFIGFIAINLIRYKVEVKYMVLNSFTDIIGRESFVDWHYTIFNVISSLCIFMFIYSFKINTERFNKIILWISDKTFGIYLVHYLILAKIDLYKFEVIEKFYLEILYLIIGTIFTFILSILIVTLIKKIKDCFIKVYKKII